MHTRARVRGRGGRDTPLPEDLLSLQTNANARLITVLALAPIPVSTEHDDDHVVGQMFTDDTPLPATLPDGHRLKLGVRDWPTLLSILCTVSCTVLFLPRVEG